MAHKDEFRAFFDAQLEPLRKLAYRLTGDWSEADDLAQEAMVRTYRAWKRTERPDLYARAALVNRHRSLLRRLSVERRVVGTRVSPSGDYATQVAEPALEAEAAAIWSELARLPTRQRAAVILHYYEDMPQTEIAQVLGCAPGTVNSLVFRALERLRARLAPDGETVRSDTT